METLETKPFTPDLRGRLAEYRTRSELNLADLARELGSNATQVSRYLNGKPTGDVAKLESVIEDMLKSESRRAESQHALFPNAISRSLGNAFDDIRETNDVGLIFAPAGIGKTCGIELYVADNKTALFVTATIWKRSGRDVESMLFAAVSTRSWDGCSKRGDYLASKLAGSNRLIIVDNAHKLLPSGRGWLFDFHDATHCPVALVGNPELLDAIRQNDQHFSRIGLKRELKIKTGDAASTARKIVQAIAPEAADDLAELAEAVAEKDGHYRAVRKEVILARKLREKGTEKNWSHNFRAAHTQLVRDYPL